MWSFHYIYGVERRKDGYIGTLNLKYYFFIILGIDCIVLTRDSFIAEMEGCIEESRNERRMEEKERMNKSVMNF